ncbi:glycosyltransferase family 2 protein, partial [Brevibacillus porteri]
MSEAPKISLCMIVKNEEECLHKCLDSVKDLVDEMIIVDTGSTDKTVEIGKSFGAVVHSYEWQDNFAEARNFGLEKATGDWILWMDA